MDKATYYLFFSIPLLSFAGCTLAAFVMRKRNRSMSLMSIICLLTTVCVFFELLRNSIPEVHSPLFSVGGLLSAAFILPFGYSYLMEFMHPYWLSWRNAFNIFFAPALLTSGIYFIQCTQEPLPLITTYEQVWQYADRPEMIIRFILALFVPVYAIILGFFVRAKRRQHERRIADDFSYTEGVNLKWINSIIIMYILYGIFTFIAASFEGAWAKIIFGVIMTIFPIINVSLCARQKELYTEQDIAFEEETESVQAEEDTAQQQITEESQETLKEQLLYLFEKEAIYTDPELSLSKVAFLLGTNRTYLSNTINESLQTNFYKLVNDYRINKAIEMMQDEALSGEKFSRVIKLSGFNSTSSFYKIFKEKTGKTPRQMREEITTNN